jgi:hypothetical protein
MGGMFRHGGALLGRALSLSFIKEVEIFSGARPHPDETKSSLRPAVRDDLLDFIAIIGWYLVETRLCFSGLFVGFAWMKSSLTVVLGKSRNLCTL